MVARIGTWLFYAIVFFLLGIWSSSHLKPVGAYLDKGVAEVRCGFGLGRDLTPSCNLRPCNPGTRFAGNRAGRLRAG